MSTDTIALKVLARHDRELFENLMTMFGEVFEELETYTHARPSAAYVESLLARDEFIALAALDGDQVVGGIAAYELKKFEQDRSEVYIYDLAVAQSHWRRGIATAMIRKISELAAARGAYVVFVQADYDNYPAIALYSKLGTREDVLHFDIDVEPVKPRNNNNS